MQNKSNFWSKEEVEVSATALLTAVIKSYA